MNSVFVHPDYLAIMRSIDASDFGKSHPDYKTTIAWRYLINSRVPVKRACAAIEKGYSSPSAAKFYGLIPESGG